MIFLNNISISGLPRLVLSTVLSISIVFLMIGYVTEGIEGTNKDQISVVTEKRVSPEGADCLSSVFPKQRFTVSY